MFLHADECDTLKMHEEKLERQSPPQNSVTAKNGVKMAPNGSLVIKGNPNAPDWMPTTEYLIMGIFSSKALLLKKYLHQLLHSSRTPLVFRDARNQAKNKEYPYAANAMATTKFSNAERENDQLK